MSGYAILSRPRMTKAGFATVLSAHHSPATPVASSCYDALVAAGVDPAVGLAVFQHESGFGTAGKAVTTRSWGNLRASDGSFKSYATWTQGCADMARLLAIYGRNEIRPGVETDTTSTFPYVWAPAADYNAPAAYGAAITAAVKAWAAAYPLVTPVKPPAAATYVVRAGDTLTSIAAALHIRATSTTPAWKRLYLANKAAIGANPNLIHPGLRLHWP